MHAYASEVRAAKRTAKHTPSQHQAHSKPKHTPSQSTRQAKAYAKPTPSQRQRSHCRRTRSCSRRHRWRHCRTSTCS
eukprot:scaffold70351_cov33-Phaeocystis_antarctica.AAC.1